MRSRPQLKETERSMPPHPAQVFHQVFFSCFNISFGLRNRTLVMHIVTRCRWIHWSEKTAALRYAIKGLPYEYVWAMTAEIPYWWRVTPQGFFNQSEALPRSAVGSDSSSVWNFCARSSDVSPRANQWTVESPNVGCFLRPGTHGIFFFFILNVYWNNVPWVNVRPKSHCSHK